MAVEVHGTSNRVQATGAGSLDGPLAAWMVEVHDGMAKPEPAFRLEAGHLHVHTVVNDPVVDAGGGTPRLGAQPDSQWKGYPDAVVTGSANRDLLRFNVFALPGHDAPQLVLRSSCLVAAPETRPPLTWSPRVPTQDANRTVKVETEGAQAFSDCSSQAQWAVTGDFLVTLWEWDAALHARGEEAYITTGQQASKAIPDTVPGVTRRAEAYLYALDAHLLLPMAPAGLTALARGADLAVEGRLVLHGAETRLEAPGLSQDQRADTLAVQGRLDAALHAADQRLAVAATGSAERIDADGQQILSATTAAETGGVSAWLLAAAGLAVAGAAGAGIAVWRRRARALATGGLAASVLQPSAAAVGHHDAVDALYRGSHNDFFAGNAVEAALACVAEGDDEGTKDWLERAFLIQPDVAMAALDLPELRRFKGDWVSASGAEPAYG